VTRFLAERFERVIAIDISPGNLKLAQEYLEESGVTNVTFHLIADPGEIAHLEGFDFFYSTIVLQHNPPPVQRFILESVFRALRSGGCVLFQIPTFEQDYGFSAEPYLRSPVPRMEMHALPMSVIFALFDACGLSCKEVVMDSATGHYGSHTFVAQKN
jgi:SAM-dependent methyltransferase